MVSNTTEGETLTLYDNYFISLYLLQSFLSDAPGDGGWAGVLQVEYLKQQLAVVLQADALPVRKREQPVVVHHAVHVLDPHSVHVAIKDQVAGRE